MNIYWVIDLFIKLLMRQGTATEGLLGHAVKLTAANKKDTLRFDLDPADNPQINANQILA